MDIPATIWLKNFSLVMPDLIEMGYSRGSLGIIAAAVSLSYGLSKFLMAGYRIGAMRGFS